MNNLKHTEEDKKYILNEHLRLIWVLTEKEYQRKVWVQGVEYDLNDYDETMCCFFDDYEFVAEEYRDLNISEEKHKILKQFLTRLRTFNDNEEIKYAGPKEFIDTPEWAKVMESAKEVLKAFNYKNK